MITIDCDVIQADGGTRTASITGGYVALVECIKIMQSKKIINTNPIKNQIAAISSGYVNGDHLIDLDYEEDSTADVDANFVINSSQDLIEIQLTSEKEACSEKQFNEMLIKAKDIISEIIKYQKNIMNKFKILKSAKKILIATNNPGKFKEIKSCCYR